METKGRWGGPSCFCTTTGSTAPKWHERRNRKTVEKKGNRLNSVSLGCVSFKKKRFSKIANLGNAPAIHNKDIVVKTCQSPPAARRAHTEPLARQGLFSPHQPTETPHGLCPARACFPSHQPTEHFVIRCYMSKPWKIEIGWKNHLVASRFKNNAVFTKCKFWLHLPYHIDLAFHFQLKTWLYTIFTNSNGWPVSRSRVASETRLAYLPNRSRTLEVLVRQYLIRTRHTVVFADSDVSTDPESDWGEER